jgi:hypothetical protein
MRTEFPTAPAFGDTQAAAARGGSFPIGWKDLSEGAGRNAGASRAQQGAHWKGNSRRDCGFSHLFHFLKKHLAISTQHSASVVSC